MKEPFYYGYIRSFKYIPIIRFLKKIFSINHFLLKKKFITKGNYKSRLESKSFYLILLVEEVSENYVGVRAKEIEHYYQYIFSSSIKGVSDINAITVTDECK